MLDHILKTPDSCNDCPCSKSAKQKCGLYKSVRCFANLWSHYTKDKIVMHVSNETVHFAGLHDPHAVCNKTLIVGQGGKVSSTDEVVQVTCKQCLAHIKRHYELKDVCGIKVRSGYSGCGECDYEYGECPL